jgi:hypothetical protein
MASTHTGKMLALPDSVKERTGRAGLCRAVRLPLLRGYNAQRPENDTPCHAGTRDVDNAGAWTHRQD